jgi:iron complex outermembrane recepter protein
MTPTTLGKAFGFALSPLMFSLSMAQTTTSQPSTSNTNASANPSGSNTQASVVVTDNPFRDADLAQPAILVSEQELRRRAASSLGETLNNLPGVNSTYFGPIASRPTIRGQDGDRIKVLNNSGSSFDVSALSFDHAVPVNPLALERVEVLRGPASLMYGGNAIGGVVNLIDRRLPRFGSGSSATANQGLKLSAEIGFGSVDRFRSAGTSLDMRQGNFAWHIDASQQQQRETSVPIVLECTRDGETTQAKKICNSQSKASDVGLGASVKIGDGYIGTSLSQYKTTYGSPSEDEVSIDMRSRRFALEGMHRVSQSLGIQSIQWQMGHTNYRHQELEGSELGTLFSNRGTDARVELRYKLLPNSQGVVGIQTEHSNFEAVGEEAFLPPSKTRSAGVFVVQDWSQAWGRLSAGLRFDRVRVQSTDEGATVSRQFSPLNLSLGGVFKLNPNWQATSNVSAGQRAPKDYELFANGPHIATGAYEIGDPMLKIEKYRSIDLGLRYKDQINTVTGNLYTTRFSNYIGLLAQPEVELDELPVYAYVSHRAAFTGFEIEWTSQITKQLQIKSFVDSTKATNLETKQALPRIAPLRFGASAVWSPTEQLTLDFGVNRFAKQSRVPEGELVTTGATLFNAAAQWSQRLGGLDLIALVKVDNLTNRLAYSASSILSQTAPGRVPLPGRNVQLKLKVNF